MFMQRGITCPRVTNAFTVFGLWPPLTHPGSLRAVHTLLLSDLAICRHPTWLAATGLPMATNAGTPAVLRRLLPEQDCSLPSLLFFCF